VPEYLQVDLRFIHLSQSPLPQIEERLTKWGWHVAKEMGVRKVLLERDNLR
jgi:hypothetical protein